MSGCRGKRAAGRRPGTRRNCRQSVSGCLKQHSPARLSPTSGREWSRAKRRADRKTPVQRSRLHPTRKPSPPGTHCRKSAYAITAAGKREASGRARSHPHPRTPASLREKPSPEAPPVRRRPCHEPPGVSSETPSRRRLPDGNPPGAISSGTGRRVRRTPTDRCLLPESIGHVGEHRSSEPRVGGSSPSGRILGQALGW